MWQPISNLLYPDLPADEDEPKIYRSVNELWPEWHKQANCLGKDEAIFFGSSDPDERPAYTLSSIKEAKRACATCPVFEQCLRGSFHFRERYGLWAGTTAKERGKLFKHIDDGDLKEEAVINYILEVHYEQERDEAV